MCTEGLFVLQTLAKHIMNIHMMAGQTSDESNDGELSLLMIKKFINYCRK